METVMAHTPWERMRHTAQGLFDAQRDVIAPAAL